MKPKLYKSFKTTFLSTLVLIWSLSAIAQDRRITGNVTSKDGSVPGANVLLKGTTTGTSTDAEGKFSLNVTGANPVLVISAIGYKTREVEVGTQSAVSISLDDDVTALSEVVVTGYTTDSRRETTGSVSIVKAQDVKVIPSGNVEQQLAGRVSGLTVITNGQPGTASQVRVRGFGAFGGNEPLYVVDGVPVGSTDFLAPDDIETVTVLKDAAAASIYGARAANGVIVYTTRKGTKTARKLQVTYDGQYGVTLPGKGQEMLNPTDFATWTWNAFRNTGWKPGDKEWVHPQFGSGATPVIPDYLIATTIGSDGKPVVGYGVTGNIDLVAAQRVYNVDPTVGSVYQVVRANKEGTDWYDAITRVAPMQRHGLGFSGGSESARYYLSFSAQNQAGILLYNDFKRYTFRANTEFNLGNRVRIGENLQFTYRSVLGQSGGNNGQGVAADENDILSAFRMPSIIPIYDEFGGYAGTAAKGFNNPRNPVASRDGQRDNRNFNVNGFGNLYVEYDPIPGLTLRSSLGGQYNNYYGFGYSRLQYENSENNSAFGYNEFSGYQLSWVFTNTANYKKRFGVHSIDVLVGQEALNTGIGRNMNGSGLNPFLTDPLYVTLNTVAASGRQVGSNYFRGVNFYSLFTRAVYNLNDKYIITGVLRRDGSSRFGPANRYGVFPAISAAWRISAEDFMKGLTWITDLKIRGGYGGMGNSNNLDPNNQRTLFGSSISLSSYDIGGTNGSTAEGFYRTRIGNADAKWETSITKNIGFDGTFFNGKLDVILDLWQKDTKDLLFQQPITATLGYRAAAPFVNIGKMTNKGIDLQVTTRGRISNDVTYDLTVTGGLLSNKIVSLSPGLDYITYVNPGFRGINPIRNQIGYSISSFYGYKVSGLWQSQEEIDAANAAAPRNSDGTPGTFQSGAGLGRFRYEDINNDGVINADDRTYLGSPVPKFSGGLALTLRYKAFDLTMYMNSFLGNKIFNVSRWFTDFYPSFAGAAISARVKDSWTPENRDTNIPIFESVSNFSTNTQSNSYYVEDGSYLRMQNLALGYNVPAAFLGRIGMQRARIFISTNNLFTLTKYSGLDPGVGGNADTNFGIDLGNYPLTRQILGGISIAF